MTWYKTGTVTVTNGSGVVAGTGTAWIANAKVGAGFKLPGGDVYEITAVNSDTQITISPAYLGSTQSGQAYAIVPVVGIYQRAYDAMQSAVGQWQTFLSTALAGLFKDGTAAAPGIGFEDETNTGLFRKAAGQMGLAVLGVQRVLLSATGFKIDVPITGTAVQANSYDATAGRLLGVGAFGLGGISAIAETDLDLFPQGFAITQFGANLTNAPAGLAGGERAVVLTTGSPGAWWQIMISRANQRMWFRGGSNGLSEGTWREVFSNQSILGTVSQSGGVPTGAVIEHGSNANGEYVRFADGTQICTHSITTSDTVGVVWTYPAAFSAGASVSTICPSAGGPVVGTISSGSASGVTLHAWSAAGARLATTVKATAVGRWF